MQKPLLALLIVWMLPACTHMSKEAYWNRGDPANLLDVSAEVVNISLDSPAAVHELTEWVNHDQPTRAELNCSVADPACRRAAKVLDQFGVAYQTRDAGTHSVALMYDRIMARDCDSRYIDNSSNVYNFNHPTFGCSISANMAQMVTDKRVFIDPPLLENADAEKATQAYRGYAAAPEKNADGGTESLLNIQTQ